MPVTLTHPQQYTKGEVALTAGTTQTQAGATLLTGSQNQVTTGVASDGVVLPSAALGTVLTVVNLSANALKIYPPVGGSLNGGTVNVAISLTASKSALVVFSSEINAAVIQGA